MALLASTMKGEYNMMEAESRFKNVQKMMYCSTRVS